MKTKTQDLTGPALDWAVEEALGGDHTYRPREYSTDWSQGGPIIERERIQTTPRGETTDLWEAIVFDNIFMDDGSECFQTGPAPLIAAMRCYVASRLGDEVDIPEELTEEEA
jgi:hypothetical protein